MPQPSAETVQQIWIITLVVYAVVVLVVATMLTLILREAKRIHAGVAEIWTVGQKVANNTIHIPLLDRTNQLAGEILDTARGVVGATAALATHAGQCSGCPTCVRKGGWFR